MIAETHKSPCARVSGLPYADVSWTGGFYKERFDVCAGTTVGHLQNMFERADISHVLENFKIAAGEAEGEFDGTVFGDGDFYKWMEAAVYTAVRTGNDRLLARLEEYIALFSRAQQPDGYLSTKQIIGEKRGNGVTRQGDINDFEVYNMGHLFTSACLYYRLTGSDSFLKVAEKAAGYLKKMYEEAAAKGEVKTAVCPSHYMGLIELYRTTGKEEYLELADLAVRLRDSVKNGLDDNQDRIPLKTHRKIVGHAVRSNYLYAGVADLYLEKGDREYLEVLNSVWDHLVHKKIYITGGCGALYNGASPYGNFMNHQLVHQAYGYEYQLPNITAYNETCANLGACFWAWRMFCINPCAEYMDVLERIMLNVNFAGISLDGKRFFYENMLRRAKKLDYELIWGQERSEYILSYCCPPNLARTIAQTSEYAWAEDGDGIWTGLYGDNTAKFRLENGAEFTLSEKTDYPWDGRIEFELTENNGVPFTLHVRIPGWAGKGSLSCGNLHRELAAGDAGRYLEIRMDPASCTRVVLTLEMAARLTRAHRMIEEDTNQVAVERGPLVYCIESGDVEVTELSDLLMPMHPVFRTETLELENCRLTALRTELFVAGREPAESEELYEDYSPAALRQVPVRMIPYFAWDNRGMGEMLIWIPLAWRD